MQYFNTDTASSISRLLHLAFAIASLPFSGPMKYHSRLYYRMYVVHSTTMRTSREASSLILARVMSHHNGPRNLR